MPFDGTSEKHEPEDAYYIVSGLSFGLYAQLMSKEHVKRVVWQEIAGETVVFVWPHIREVYDILWHLIPDKGAIWDHTGTWALKKEVCRLIPPEEFKKQAS